MMAAQAALKAGVGLLTVGIPESLHAAFAAPATRSDVDSFTRDP
ncbi:MAG: hypothetical protein ACJZ7A_05240 [Opitutales bacterium]